MIVTHDLAHLATLERPLHLAMGVFDGVHRGHQVVIQEVIDAAGAARGIPAVLTFDPFPLQVLAPERAPQKILAHIDHKRALLEAMGVELMVVIPFDHAFAQLQAREFLALLNPVGGLAQLSVGEDWKFGRGREGKLSFLSEYCAEQGIQLSATPPVMADGERISSTRIRQAIRDGNLQTAQDMLGRPYTLSGPVVQGDQIGRTIGFPTANVDSKNEILPPMGVYAVRVQLGQESLRGVANLGVRPTVGGELAQRFEVHLFDFEREIYGAELTVEFVAFIRGEQKFDGLGALVEQIEKDCTIALEKMN